MITIHRIVCASLLSAAVGCSGGPACSTSGDCAEDEDGYVCVEEVCQACAADAECEEAYGAGAACEDGRCVLSCAPGEEGCTCRADGGCDAALACVAGECVTAEGCLGCPCTAAGTCLDDLECSGGICEEPDCPPGTDTCACFPGGVCDPGLTCDDSRCRLCVPGERMCACGAGDACEEGTACGASAMCPAGVARCCLLTDCELGTRGCTCNTSLPECAPGAICRGGLCVCDHNYAGDRCEIPCTDTQLAISTDPIFDPDRGTGFWMCAHFAASDPMTVTSGTLTLRGEIPFAPVERTTLSGGTFTVVPR